MVSHYSDQTDYKLWEEFIMWSRADLKSRAKEILKVNYWKTVLISLIFMFVSGSGSSSGATSSSSNSSADFSDLQDTLSSPGESAGASGWTFYCPRCCIYYVDHHFTTEGFCF